MANRVSKSLKLLSPCSPLGSASHFRDLPFLDPDGVYPVSIPFLTVGAIGVAARETPTGGHSTPIRRTLMSDGLK